MPMRRPPIKSGEIAEYQPTLQNTGTEKCWFTSAAFSLAAAEIFCFPVESYPAVKGLFDAINKADNHTITLKQSAATANSN